MELSEKILAYYNQGQEKTRLAGAILERLRTESILHRFLPRPPATILDVGGADGVYAFPLARAEYHVHLIDPVPLHVQQALGKSKSTGIALASIQVGDARRLELSDSSADAVLYLGPLYHLTSASERLMALREAYRTLKPGRVLLAAFISRFASVLDGTRQRLLERDEFAEIVAQDLRDGQHRNPTNDPRYFTDAYFHHPDEARAEVARAGFENVRLVAVEGPLWLVSDIEDQLTEPRIARRLLELMEQIEADETLIGASAHFMVVADKPV
jgi:ubiquinone/menaquinone biosynthesis C-methylase UbiE